MLTAATKGDMKNAPPDAFLYCPECGDRYSATYGDYFMLSDSYKFHCNGEGSHEHTPMILATEQREIIPVRA